VARGGLGSATDGGAVAGQILRGLEYLASGTALRSIPDIPDHAACVHLLETPPGWSLGQEPHLSIRDRVSIHQISTGSQRSWDRTSSPGPCSVRYGLLPLAAATSTPSMTKLRRTRPRRGDTWFRQPPGEIQQIGARGQVLRPPQQALERHLRNLLPTNGERGGWEVRRPVP